MDLIDLLKELGINQTSLAHRGTKAPLRNDWEKSYNGFDAARKRGDSAFANYCLDASPSDLYDYLKAQGNIKYCSARTPLFQTRSSKN